MVNTKVFRLKAEGLTAAGGAKVYLPPAAPKATTGDQG